MTNRYQPHVLVLPEDDANRQIANGFLLNPNVALRRIQILEPAGGWTRVRDEFERTHVDLMDAFRACFMVLLIDFDRDPDRFEQIKQKIPENLANRVFVLGAFGEPEDLKRADLGSFEKIGRDMADECENDLAGIWRHGLLQHNERELRRLHAAVHAFLFTG